MRYDILDTDGLLRAAFTDAETPLERALTRALETVEEVTTGAEQQADEATKKLEEAEAEIETLRARIEELDECCGAFRGMLRAWSAVFPGCPDDEAVGELVEETGAVLSEYPSEQEKRAAEEAKERARIEGEIALCVRLGLHRNDALALIGKRAAVDFLPPRGRKWRLGRDCFLSWEHLRARARYIPEGSEVRLRAL